jgi:hypothetical protein
MCAINKVRVLRLSRREQDMTPTTQPAVNPRDPDADTFDCTSTDVGRRIACVLWPS